MILCLFFSHKTFYGKQVWYLRITKYKQKLPSSTENILFLYFWFYFRWFASVCCVCVLVFFLNLLLMPFEVLAEFYQILVNASSTCVHYRFRCHAYLQLRQIVPKYVSVKTDDKRFREMSLKSECSWKFVILYCFAVLLFCCNCSFVFSVYDESMPVNWKMCSIFYDWFWVSICVLLESCFS